MATGLNAQLGLSKETTYGTRVVPSRFFPFKSESVSLEVSRIESEAIYANQVLTSSADWAVGTKKISGGFDLDCHVKGEAILWELALGSVTTTGASAPYAHTCVPAANLKSFTLQVGKPRASSTTVDCFEFTGCVVESWELSGEVDAPISLSLGIIASDESTSQSLATASYPSGNELLTGATASVSASGDVLTDVCVKSFSISGNNALAGERFCLGGNVSGKPQSDGLREITGTLTVEHDSLAALDAYRDGDELELEIVILENSGSPVNGVTITANIRLDEVATNVSGGAALETTIGFKVIRGGTVASGISVVVVNGDSAA